MTQPKGNARQARIKAEEQAKLARAATQQTPVPAPAPPKAEPPKRRSRKDD